MKEYPYIMEAENLGATWGGVPSMLAFSSEHLREIFNSSKIREYDAGETIIQEGQAEHCFYVLVSGKVKVVKDEEEIASFDQTGDIFGEVSVLNNEVRSATVEAVGTTHCLAVDAQFVDKLSPEGKAGCCAVLYHMLGRLVAERLRTTNEELVRVKQELEELRSRTTDSRA
jgi:CRP-like cAMP-binding protein